LPGGAREVAHLPWVDHYDRQPGRAEFGNQAVSSPPLASSTTRATVKLSRRSRNAAIPLESLAALSNSPVAPSAKSKRALLTSIPTAIFGILWVSGQKAFHECSYLARLLDKIGVDNIPLETDFPHPTSLYGDEAHARIKAGLSDREESVWRKILWAKLAEALQSYGSFRGRQRAAAVWASRAT
jgi:hypothetical protein